MPPLVAEVLVAVGGVFPEGPFARVQLDAARNLPRDWQVRVRDWFDRETPARFRGVRRLDHRRTLERLSEPLTADAGAVLIAGLPDDVGAAYLVQLESAREYLRARWPSLSLETPTGPRLLEPGVLSMGEASSLFEVVDDPERVLLELEMASLTSAQAEAFRTVYPALTDMLRAQFDEQLIMRKARRKGYELSWFHERLLRIFFGLPPSISIVATGAPETSKANPQIDFDMAATTTKSQRLESELPA
jgi:hypothetical protein